jgi:CelD/BcsL family acetyltransferase involved in cellulose biosynthesis
MSPELAHLRLEPLDDLESARATWEPLSERSDNVFSTWEWASSWWKEFGRDRPLLLTAVLGDGGEPVALLPLYLSARRPLRTIRFLGHGPADQLGPVCDAERLDDAMAALRRALAAPLFPWGLFIADRLPGGHDWNAALGARTLERQSSPLMHTDGRSWDEFLASRSKNFREQVRRRERKLAREHELRFRLTTAERFDGDFDTLVRLHDVRWGDGSQAFTGALERFHRDFARRALDRGWLRLWVMEVDGQAVAAWYGYRFGGVESYYNSGRDRSWDSYRVGFVLLVHTMREAFDDGMREYRMLRGGEEYKSRFATDDAGVDTMALSRGVGRAAFAVGTVMKRALPWRVRQRLARLAGS